MPKRLASRRALARGLALLAGGAALAACAPAAPPTNTPAPAKPTEAPKPAAAAASTAAPAAAAAPKTKGPEKVGVRLGWLGNGEFAVLYVGMGKGFYENEGILLDPHDGGPGKNPIVFVAAGQDDTFGVTAGGNSIFQARVGPNPVDVVAIGTLLQVHPFAYIRLAKAGTPDPTPKDLVGKTVGVQPASEYYVEALATQNGLDPKGINIAIVGATPEQLLVGKIDYFAGWVTNQAYDIDQQLKKDNRTGEVWQPLLYNKWGSPSYADTLFCTGQTLKQRPDLVRGFLGATAKAMEFLYNNPKDSIPLITKYTTLDPPEKLDWRLKQQNPLMVSADTTEKGVLWMNPAVWQKSIDFYFDNKQMPAKAPVDQVMTNEFLPGAPKL
ncbi:MAG TPA: ABC transporter substrate-binding protein [Chloroflexota bacterium]